MRNAPLRDHEIRQLLEHRRHAARQEEDGPLIGHSSQRKLSRPGTVDDPSVSDENESIEDKSHVDRRGDDPARKEQMFATLRHEILAARLKVTLDEQLNRETSTTVQHLAKMKLSPLRRQQ